MNLAFRKNKKGGSAFDIIYIFVIFFVIAVLTLVAVKLFNEWQEKSADKLTTETSQIALQKVDMALTSLDAIFAFVIGMLFILVFISAFTIDTRPAFFVVTLIILIIAIILAVVFSNIYEVISTEKFPEEAERYPITNQFMGKLPFIVLAGIITLSIVLYAKFKT